MYGGIIWQQVKALGGCCRRGDEGSENTRSEERGTMVKAKGGGTNINLGHRGESEAVGNKQSTRRTGLATRGDPPSKQVPRFGS